jgi:type VI protein secretion system component VasF
MNEPFAQHDTLLNLIPASSQKRQATTNAYQPYLRSNLITNQPQSILEATNAFFSGVMRFKQHPEHKHTQMLEWLEHQCALFEHNLQKMNYERSIRLAASYILRLWAYDQLKVHLIPQQDLLLLTQDEQTSTDPLTKIALFCIQNPKPHLDLLELIYLCFKTGYQSNQQPAPQIIPTQQTILNQVYQCLIDHRDFNPDSLLPPHNLTTQYHYTPPPKKHLWWLIGSACAIVSLLIATSHRTIPTPTKTPPTHLVMKRISHVPTL